MDEQLLIRQQIDEARRDFAAAAEGKRPGAQCVQHHQPIREDKNLTRVK